MRQVVTSKWAPRLSHRLSPGVWETLPAERLRNWPAVLWRSPSPPPTTFWSPGRTQGRRRRLHRHRRVPGAGHKFIRRHSALEQGCGDKHQHDPTDQRDHRRVGEPTRPIRAALNSSFVSLAAPWAGSRTLLHPSGRVGVDADHRQRGLPPWRDYHGLWRFIQYGCANRNCDSACPGWRLDPDQPAAHVASRRKRAISRRQPAAPLPAICSSRPWPAQRKLPRR